MMVCPACDRSFDEGRFCPVDGVALLGPDGRPRRDSMEGQVVGDTFQIDGVLGRGAGGTVYAATQIDLARPVALKVLAQELARSHKNVARFEREARALARIEDPGVVAVYAIGRTADDRPFLAMERVDGATLEDEVREGPLPPARAVVIARRIASALEAVHAAGLVHRDLKPSNVMIAPGDVVKLLDFGVVKLDDATKLTAGGEALGTPHYMAPEQATGEECDARTDLYALGAILFRMLTGTVPFEGTGMQVMMAHVGRPAPRIADRVPQAGSALDGIVARCLAKRPHERFASAAEVGAALEAAAQQLARRVDARAFEATLPRSRTQARASAVAQIDTSTATRTRRFARRVETDIRSLLPPRHGLRVALGLLIAIGVGVGGWAAWRGRVAFAERVALSLRPVAPAASTTITPDGPHGDVTIVGTDYAMRVSLPAPLEVGRSADIVLAIWDRDGAPLVGAETVVTVTAPSGTVMGLRASERAPGTYRFRAHFTEIGDHVLRVFLPVGDATLTVPLAVARGTGTQA